MRTKSKMAMVLGIIAIMMACTVSAVIAEDSHDADATSSVNELSTSNKDYTWVGKECTWIYGVMTSSTNGGEFAGAYYTYGINWVCVSESAYQTSNNSSMSLHGMNVNGSISKSGGNQVFGINMQIIGTATQAGDWYVSMSVTYTKTSDSSTTTVLYGVHLSISSGYTYEAVLYYGSYNNGAYSTYSNDTSSVTQATQGATGSHTFTVSNYTPIKSGYTFLGWTTTPGSSTVEYVSGDTITVNYGSSIGLYSVWQANTNTYFAYLTYSGYKTDYHTMTGTSPSGSHSFTITSYKGTYSDGNKQYSIAGWSTSQNSTTIQYNAGSTISVAFGTTTTLYPVWTYKTVTYTVSFDANGGTGSISDITDDMGKVITLPSSGFTRQGYTFLGWSTYIVSSTVQYDPGDTLTLNTNLTLYAVWKVNQNTGTCNIGYDLNGGQALDPNAFSTVSVLSGNSIYLPISNITKVGFYLAGWNEGSVSGKFYSPGEEYVVVTSLTMYANWVAVNTNVFDNDAPSGIDVGENYSYSPDMISDLWLPLSYDNSTTNYSLVWINHPSWLTYSKSEYMYDSGLVHRQAWQYTFSGIPAEVGIYNVKIQVGNTSDTIQWTITVTDPSTMGNYEVSFSAGSGNGSASSQSGVLGSAIKLPSSGFTKDGYRLAYWSTTIDGTTVYYPLGSIYTITEDKVFTAFYVANNGIIIFDANGGTVSDTTSSYMAYIVQTDGVVTLPSSGLTKDGGTFAGWYLSSDNKSIYAPGYLYKISSVSSTIVMMAYWLPETISYEVIYNANGGVGALSQTVEEGYKVVMPTGGYVYNGHVLASWNTSQDGSGTSYALGAKVQIFAYVTLYAQWTVSSGTTGTTHSVTFDLNGAFGATQSQSVESGNMAIKPTDPTRPYYGFMYWQLSGSTGKYDFSTAVTSDIVLKAVWVKLFTLSTSGTTVTLEIISQYAAGSATITWGDGSENTVGNIGTYSHEYQENTIGTINLTLVVGSGSNTVTYTSYAGYSVGSTIGGNADDDGGNNDPDQIISMNTIIVIVIVIIIAIIIGATVARFR